MNEKISQNYQILNSESVVAILKKMKEYDIKYKIEINDGGLFYAKCIDMDLGQQNVMSSFGKMIKKIDLY